jgi:rod shape-determining protein MreB
MSSSCDPRGGLDGCLTLMFSSLFGRGLAVDLGTANTLVYAQGRGIVLNEPSVVAINVNTGRALAVGVDAKRMIGRTPTYIQAIRPLRDGVIANFDICERMLAYFIKRVHPSRLSKPEMVICVPSGITGVEQRAVGALTSSKNRWRPPSGPACPSTSRPGTWSWI